MTGIGLSVGRIYQNIRAILVSFTGNGRVVSVCGNDVTFKRTLVRWVTCAKEAEPFGKVCGNMSTLR